MRYRLYVIQYDDWGDEEERTIKEGTNRSQMEILFDVWRDISGPLALKLVLMDEENGEVLLEDSFGKASYYDD